MLKKSHRLTNRRAFIATYNQKRIVSDENFVLYGGKNKEEQNYPTRVGFVVSKKIHKRAVKRNRIKRLARESYQNLLNSGEIEQSQAFQSLIFVSKEAALQKNYKEICSSVKKLIQLLAIKYF